EMFLHQARGKFEHWTERAAPVDVVRAVLEKRLAREGARLGAPGAGGRKEGKAAVPARAGRAECNIGEMNIVLIVYRGTGKSSVAKLLSERTKWPLVSTDVEIVKKAGMPVPEIIRKLGWDYFRNVESEICKQVGKKDRTIIDTGGGAV